MAPLGPWETVDEPVRRNQKFFARTVQTDPTDPTSLAIGATAPNEVLALTGTLQYDLWKNVLSRLEVRWDHAIEGPAGCGGKVTGPASLVSGGGNQKEAVMIAANLIYKF